MSDQEKQWGYWETVNHRKRWVVKLTRSHLNRSYDNLQHLKLRASKLSNFRDHRDSVMTKGLSNVSKLKNSRKKDIKKQLWYPKRKSRQKVEYMDKKLKEYEAQFKPTSDDGEKMLQIKEDLKCLFRNNNEIAKWFMAMMDKINDDRKRMDTFDNIIAQLIGEKIELSNRIKGLEDFLFRDKDKTL